MGNFNYLHIIGDSQPKASKKTLTYSKPFYNINARYLFNSEHLFKHFLSPTRLQSPHRLIATFGLRATVSPSMLVPFLD